MPYGHDGSNLNELCRPIVLFFQIKWLPSFSHKGAGQSAHWVSVSVRWSAVWRISLPIRIHFCGCESLLSDLEVLTGTKTFSRLRHLVLSKSLGNTSKISTVLCLKYPHEVIASPWSLIWRQRLPPIISKMLSKPSWLMVFACRSVLWAISFLGSPAQKALCISACRHLCCTLSQMKWTVLLDYTKKDNKKDKTNSIDWL